MMMNFNSPDESLKIKTKRCEASGISHKLLERRNVMLESRIYYQPCETESDYSDFEIVRVKYSKYKEYNLKLGFKNVPNTYDSDDKTIEILIPKDYYNCHPNFGNKYRLNSYRFIIEDSHGKIHLMDCNAKNFKNAQRNIKKWCKESNYIFYGLDPDFYISEEVNYEQI